MSKTLILIPAGFPYGKSETFLETEILYLSEAFEEVTILCPKPKDTNVRELPSNCKVDFYTKELTPIDKVKSLGGLFSSSTWKEIKIISKTYKPKVSKGILSTLLISLYQAKRLAQLCHRNYLYDQKPQNETVFYSYWCDDTALSLALLKQEYPRLKCVSRMHRWDIYFEESEVNYLPFRTDIANQLNQIISISQDGIDYAVQTWKVNKDCFTLSRLGVKGSTPVIPKDNILKMVSCSNLIPVKRVHLIAEALVQIEDINIEWTHFGDGRLFDEFKKLVKKLPKNIKVNHPGRVLNQEVYEAYQKIQPHLFINVSSSEGVPVSIMEAMSFGIPCIATDVGGNREIVNNENGVLLSANPSLEAIQTAIKSCLNDESKRKAAYETWEKEYNAEKNYREFVNQLLNLK